MERGEGSVCFQEQGCARGLARKGFGGGVGDGDGDDDGADAAAMRREGNGVGGAEEKRRGVAR